MPVRLVGFFIFFLMIQRRNTLSFNRMLRIFQFPLKENINKGEVLSRNAIKELNPWHKGFRSWLVDDSLTTETPIYLTPMTRLVFTGGEIETVV